ncbi:MAG: FIST C-terminal domain-containing protein [Nannocystaceae bacterium]|nr:FIST C-terminal domain-containing protein [Nannocystaceae bacterium]
MRLHVAHSIDPATDVATAELVESLRAQAAGQRPVLAVVLAAIEHDHAALLAGLREGLGEVQIVGCSTDGELSSAAGFAEDSIVVALFCGDDVQVQVLVAESLSQGTEASVVRAFAGRSAQTPVACMVLSDGLTVDAVSLIEAASRQLPPQLPMFGGTAGDQRRMTATKQFVGTRVLGDAAVFVLFHGGLRLGIGVRSGWAPLGGRGVVTRAQGNRVYEIDGAPATDFYRKHLGPGVELSPDHPLAVGEGDAWCLRAPLGTADAPGSIVFAGAVPEGAAVQITTASRDEVLGACSRSTAQALSEYRGSAPVGAMLISCAARRQLLGTRAREEVEHVRRSFGDVPAFGFYSYGEIAPLQGEAAVDFHNETFVAVLFGAP